jgi:hypothetical protein
VEPQQLSIPLLIANGSAFSSPWQVLCISSPIFDNIYISVSVHTYVYANIFAVKIYVRTYMYM